MKNVLNQLEEHGYAVLRDVFTAHECEQMGTALDELERYHLERKTGFVTDTNRRQHTVLNVHYLAPEIFLKHIANPQVLEVVRGVLNDEFILSNFNASRAVKNEVDAFRLHIDSRKPNAHFRNTYQIVANICIDEFTATNGGTVVVDGSHTSGQDPRDIDIPATQLTPATAPRGSVVFLLGQTWHDIGHNRDGNRRWSIIAYYSCWWIKPTYDFVSACTEPVFDLADDTQKKLLGFNARPPIHWNRRQKTVTDTSQLPDRLEAAQEWDG